jgi:GR25 family glycosyltransferase involved in LPS biosynthesis
MNLFKKIKKFITPRKKDYCMFYILSLMKEDRKSYIYRNLTLFDQFDIIESVNGYNPDATIRELKNSGLKFMSLHDMNSSRYGVLANFLTKYKMLQYQIEHKIPFACFIEDDLVLKKDFVDKVYDECLHFFKKDPDLNIIRLGPWGEAYITSLDSAKRIVKLIQKKGIVDNIDNQLRLHCGKEKNLSKIFYEKSFSLRVKTNEGDCLSTNYIDFNSIDPFFLKNSDVKNYSKYHDGYLMFFSQNGTDKYLYDNLFKDFREGFFVDVGATNGINSNNTLTLERCLDWNGFLIEPSMQFEDLFTNRYNDGANVVKSQYLSDESNNNINFGHCKKSCFGSESKILSKDFLDKQDKYHTYTLQSITFTDLFLKYFNSDQVIDFMTISSNGSELNILNGIDFNSIFIRSFLIKYHNDKLLDEILLKKNYIKVCKISQYFLYLHNSSFDFFNVSLKDFPKWSNAW